MRRQIKASLAGSVLIGRWHKENAIYTRFMSTKSVESLEMIDRATAAIRDGNFNSAAGMLDAVLRSAPTHSQALFMRAVVHTQMGESRESLEKLAQLAKLSPDIAGSAQYLSAKAHALSAVGEYRTAIAHFARMFQLDSQHFSRLAADFVRHTTGSKQHLLVRAPQGLFAGEQGAQQVFTRIYEEGLWGGGSGPGSHPSNAALYAGYVQYLIRQLNVRRVLDLGCGDWQFSQFLDFTGVDYIGIDIVGSLVKQNIAKFTAKNIHFMVGDATDYPLGNADLVLCKDVIQHLDDDSALRILQKLPTAAAWLITNDYTGHNEPGGMGDARPIDPTAPPFSIAAQPVLTFGDKVSYLAVRAKGAGP